MTQIIFIELKILILADIPPSYQIKVSKVFIGPKRPDKGVVERNSENQILARMTQRSEEIF